MGLHPSQIRAIETLAETSDELLTESILSLRLRSTDRQVRFGIKQEVARQLPFLLSYFKGVRERFKSTLENSNLRSGYVDVVKNELKRRSNPAVTRARVSLALSTLFSNNFFSFKPSPFETSKLEEQLAMFNDIEEYEELKGFGRAVTARRGFEFQSHEGWNFLIDTVSKKLEDTSKMAKSVENKILDSTPVDLVFNIAGVSNENAMELSWMIKRPVEPGYDEWIEAFPDSKIDERKFNELLKDLHRLREAFALIETMREDYEKELDRIEYYELADENTPPILTFSQVVATFSVEDLRNVIDHQFQAPRLILVAPNIPLGVHYTEDQISLEKITASHGPRKIRVGHSYYFKNNFLENWQVFLVEGPIEIDREAQGFGDSVEKWYPERIKHFEDFCRQKNVQMTTCLILAHLDMANFMEGKIIDPELNRTFLRSEEFIPENVVFTHGDCGFGPSHLTGKSNTNYFRRCIGGDVPKS